MEPYQIKHVSNKFESFTATRNFALGTTGVSIMEGSEVLFDGTTVMYNESKYPLPTLRGAITLKWLVPTASYDPNAGPISGVVSANIGLRPAVTNSQSLTQQPTRTAAVTVQSDERVVMTRAASTAKTVRGGYDVEPQDARPVARAFSTPAKVSTDMSYAGAAISQAEAVKIRPGVGVGESEYLARLSVEDQEKYISDKESRKAVYDAELLAKGIAPSAPTVVAQVRKVSSTPTSTEGIRSTLSVSGGTEVYDPSTGDVKPVLSKVAAEGITFSNTNGPVRAFQAPKPLASPASVLDSTTDARRAVAKALCVDFPDNYSFDDHWKRRLARIQLDYADRLDVIRAIFAAETDDFKKLILAEFPDAFKS